MTIPEIQTVRTPGYTKRVKAVKQSIKLLHSMQVQTPVSAPFGGRPGVVIERTDAVELARFLLGLGEEQP